MTGVPSGSSRSSPMSTVSSRPVAAPRRGYPRSAATPAPWRRSCATMTGVPSGSPRPHSVHRRAAAQRLLERAAVGQPPHPHGRVRAAADDDRVPSGSSRLPQRSPGGVGVQRVPDWGAVGQLLHPHRPVAAAYDDRGAIRQFRPRPPPPRWRGAQRFPDRAPLASRHTRTVPLYPSQPPLTMTGAPSGSPPPPTAPPCCSRGCAAALRPGCRRPTATPAPCRCVCRDDDGGAMAASPPPPRTQGRRGAAEAWPGSVGQPPHPHRTVELPLTMTGVRSGAVPLPPPLPHRRGRAAGAWPGCRRPATTPAPFVALPPPLTMIRCHPAAPDRHCLDPVGVPVRTWWPTSGRRETRGAARAGRRGARDAAAGPERRVVGPSVRAGWPASAGQCRQGGGRSAGTHWR